MATSIITRSLVLIAALALSGGAHAFKIDPEVRPEKAFKAKYNAFLDHYLYPIHERMAALAYLCAQNQSDETPCPGRNKYTSLSFPGEVDLFHGARWNDDPNNSFPYDNGVTWVFWIQKASEAAKSKKGVERINPLEYRSHYGDLQFLHAMAQKVDQHSQTRERIVDWSHFAYSVAIGEIPPSASLHSLIKDYPFTRYLDGLNSKKDWTVRRLFLNVRDLKGGELQDIPDSSVPMIALGALLYTVQDSYSSSHTTRLMPATPSASQAGPVQGFLDFSLQKAACHSGSDLDAGWLEEGSSEAFDNPIYYGAWIIRRALRKASWAEVAPEFDHIYFVTNGAGTANSGGFDHCR